MKLTPLDIHHKEFHRAIRGYNEEEVDDFLDEVAEEFEKLFKENIDLKEQIEKVKEKAGQFENLQSTIQNVLITAQKSADEVLAQAKRDAEQIIRDAEARARELIEEASRGKEDLEASFADLKNAEREFRERFKSMLESYLRLVEGEMERPKAAFGTSEFSGAEPSEVPSAEEGDDGSLDRGDEVEFGGGIAGDSTEEPGLEGDVPETTEHPEPDEMGEVPVDYPVLENGEKDSEDRETGSAAPVYTEKSDL